MEKMIVVEKSTKWWLTIATGGALAVGLLGGYGLATAIHGTNSQQSAIQQPATMPGAPEQGQNGQEGGMQPQDDQQSGKDKSKDSSAEQNDNGKKNKKKSSTNTNEQSDKDNNKSTKENKTSQS